MDARTKARKLTTAQPTATLITSLRAIADPQTPEERMVRAWIIDELEERHPAASDAVSTAFEASEARIMAGEENVPEVDYVVVLLGAIPA